MRPILITALIVALFLAGPLSVPPAQAQPAGSAETTVSYGWSTPSVLVFTAAAVVGALALDIYTGGALSTPLANAGVWLSETLLPHGAMVGRAAMRPTPSLAAPAIVAPGLAALEPIVVADTAPGAALSTEAVTVGSMRAGGPGRLQVQAAETQRPGCYQITVCAPRIRPVEPEAAGGAAPPVNGPAAR